MRGPFRIEGHAIASEDGMIADSTGLMPNSLKFPSDQKAYETALDGASALVNGHLSYEWQANSPARKRLVVTRRVAGLAPDPGNPNARLWNPAGASFDDACASLGVRSGTVAVIGGTFVFSLFLTIGYDAFHLSHAPGVRLAGGLPVFREQADGRSPEAVLAGAGLAAGPARAFADGVTMVEWTRAP
ncbi:dihydrofolate reductase [Roseiarcus fermentans]|uniref:Dihydrofolate reductase n=1 Tax=Roseiarcus fermentans TaxID=1473586 RepID=A0A366F6G4_9HYPH|nr:dihydrofolate reductase [Roseiarcus fermentans]RBP09736.1 dihydrofolate reductase [Roseiarcus fermentans]